MGVRTFVVIMLVACACDSPTPGAVVSGSRLRARYLVDGEGARQFAGFHDRELGLDCAWAGTSPPRCLPEHVETNLFLDGTCTTPLVAVDPAGTCPAIPTYATTTRDACSYAPERLWRVEADAFGGQLYSYDVARALCAPVASTPGIVYRRVTEVPTSTLVSGSFHDDGDGRMRYHTVVGSDGSRQPMTAFDHELGVTCDVTRGEPRCVPAYAGTSYSLDATCAQRVAPVRRGCEAPRLLGHYQDDRYRLWRTGAVVTPPPTTLYVDLLVVATGWTCTAQNVSIDPAYDLYRAGAPLADDAVSPVERVLDPGGRLQPWMQEAGGYRQFDVFHDRDLDRDCTVTQVDDGDWRCLPALARVSHFSVYLDAQCTEPVGAVAWWTADDGSDPLGAVESEACGVRKHLHRLGPAFAALYYRNPSAGTCDDFGAVDEHGVAHAFMVGDEIAFGAFAALTPLTE